MPSPLEYIIDPDRRLVQVNYARQPAFGEWEAAMDLLFADPRFQPTFGILLNRTRLTGAPLPDYIGRQVQYFERKCQQFPALRWAVVATDVYSYGLGQMAEKMVRADTVRVFLGSKEAMEWLASQRIPGDEPLEH
jgi:hypothetical protein